MRHPTKNSTFLRTHNSTGSEQNKMSAAYSSCMNSLMSFLDNTEYADNTAYSPERLAQVTDVDIYRYFANKAFGTPEPSADDLPNRCRLVFILAGPIFYVLLHFFFSVETYCTLSTKFSIIQEKCTLVSKKEVFFPLKTKAKSHFTPQLLSQCTHPQHM